MIKEFNDKYPQECTLEVFVMLLNEQISEIGKISEENEKNS